MDLFAQFDLKVKFTNGLVKSSGKVRVLASRKGSSISVIGHLLHQCPSAPVFADQKGRKPPEPMREWRRISALRVASVADDEDVGSGSIPCGRKRLFKCAFDVQGIEI